MLLDFAAHLPAIPARHHHVQKHQRRFDLLERLHGFVAIVGDGNRVSPRFQIVTDDVSVICVVIDH